MIPALFDVIHAAYVAGGKDVHNNPVDSWSSPVAKKFVTWGRFDTDEPAIAGHDRDVVDARIIVYPDFGVVAARDRMTVDGVTYEVVGVPERFDKAWWPSQVANWTIDLRKVSG